MKYIFYFVLSCLIANPLWAQEINSTALASIVNEIKTVDIDAVDFKDLEPLKRAIGNSRVVVLGEQDHGDATSLAAKSRLVKFLYEKMGFKVLAFETDAYSLLSLEKEKNKPFYLDSLKSSIPAYWS